jgi:urease accessory protein
LELAILHPPGGLVEGDSLSVSAEVLAGARVLVTGPAAQKLYRARARQSVSVDLKVEAADLEWLPPETIAHRGAQGSLTLRAEVAPEGRFFGWDVLALGAGEGEFQGEVRQFMEIRRAGRLIWRERRGLIAPGTAFSSPLGLAGRPVTGVFWALGRASEAALLAQAAAMAVKAAEAAESQAAATESQAAATERTAAAARGSDLSGLSGLTGLTVRAGLLVARFLGFSVEAARAYLESVWRATRAVFGFSPYRPRFWPA